MPFLINIHFRAVVIYLSKVYAISLKVSTFFIKNTRTNIYIKHNQILYFYKVFIDF